MECGVGYYTQALVKKLTSVMTDRLLVLTTTTPHNHEFDKLEIISAPGWKLKNLFSLITTCNNVAPDIIHIQYPTVGYKRSLGINLLPYALRIFRKESKIILTLHELFGSPLLGKWRNLITALPAHSIVVSNRADFNALPKFLQRRTSIIPLGSTIESISVSEDKAKVISHAHTKGFDSDLILFFGFPFPSKNLESLIEAMEILSNKRLIIASRLDPNNMYERSLLQKISSVDPTGEKIIVLGFQPNDILLGLIQYSFCFVLPQRLPLNTKSSTVLAALMNHLPLIGAKGTTIENEPFQHKKTAILLSEMASSNIASAIQALSKDRELYDHLSLNLRHLSLQYSWNVITRKHAELYDQF